MTLTLGAAFCTFNLIKGVVLPAPTLGGIFLIISNPFASLSLFFMSLVTAPREEAGGEMQAVQMEEITSRACYVSGAQTAGSQSWTCFITLNQLCNIWEENEKKKLSAALDDMQPPKHLQANAPYKSFPYIFHTHHSGTKH